MKHHVLKAAFIIFFGQAEHNTASSNNVTPAAVERLTHTVVICLYLPFNEKVNLHNSEMDESWLERSQGGDVLIAE